MRKSLREAEIEIHYSYTIENAAAKFAPDVKRNTFFFVVFNSIWEVEKFHQKKKNCSIMVLNKSEIEQY